MSANNKSAWKISFEKWFEKRGVWPRLNSQEIFKAGWNSALQQVEFQNLTTDEILEAAKGNVEGEHMLPYAFARAIEAKLREKNRSLS